MIVTTTHRPDTEIEKEELVLYKIDKLFSLKHKMKGSMPDICQYRLQRTAHETTQPSRSSPRFALRSDPMRGTELHFDHQVKDEGTALLLKRQPYFRFGRNARFEGIGCRCSRSR